MDVRHVSVQAVLPLKPPTAERAGNLLIGVNDLMSLQVIITAEPLAAGLTGKPRPLVVFPLLVMFQQLSGPEGNTTNIAGNFLGVFLVDMQLVRLQTALVSEGFPTGLTEEVEFQFCLLFTNILFSQVNFPKI